MTSKCKEIRLCAQAAITLVLEVAILAGCPGTKAHAGDKGHLSVKEFFSPDSVVFGRTYSEWSAASWQYALSLPANASPLFDTADCKVGQSGPVFFLEGKACAVPAPPGSTCSSTHIVRNCTMPTVKGIYVPIVANEESLQEEQVNPTGPPPGTALTTISQLREFVASTMDGATGLFVTLDGKSLENPAAFRVQSPAFAFTLPDRNV